MEYVDDDPAAFCRAGMLLLVLVTFGSWRNGKRRLGYIPETNETAAREQKQDVRGIADVAHDAGVG